MSRVYDRRNEKLAQGLCGSCGSGAPMPDRQNCDACVAAEIERVRKKRKAGLCRTCSTKAVKGRSYCQRHLDYYARYRREQAGAR